MSDVRLAALADVPGIQALMRSVGGFWDEAWRADVLERALGSPDAVALVHDEGGALRGPACAHDVAFRAYLSELVVARGAQGGGVGGAARRDRAAWASAAATSSSPTCGATPSASIAPGAGRPRRWCSSANASMGQHRALDLDRCSGAQWAARSAGRTARPRGTV